MLRFGSDQIRELEITARFMREELKRECLALADKYASHAAAANYFRRYAGYLADSEVQSRLGAQTGWAVQYAADDEQAQTDVSAPSSGGLLDRLLGRNTHHGPEPSDPPSTEF
jgi:hypothetical protein